MVHTIPFEVKELETASYHPILRGKINGFEVNLIIDTGASRTVIDKSITVNFPVIQIDSVEPYAAGINAQKIAVEQVEIPSFILGEVDFGKTAVFITDLSPISQLYNEMVNFPIHGLLGCDFLENFKAKIDFKTRTISVKISKRKSHKKQK